MTSKSRISSHCREHMDQFYKNFIYNDHKSYTEAKIILLAVRKRKYEVFNAQGLEQEKDSSCQYEQIWGWDKTRSRNSRVTTALKQIFS